MISHNLIRWPYVRPFGDFGAKPIWMRCDTNPAKIEPIRIPAGLYGDVRMRPLMCMTDTRSIQQFETG